MLTGAKIYSIILDPNQGGTSFSLRFIMWTLAQAALDPQVRHVWKADGLLRVFRLAVRCESLQQSANIPKLMLFQGAQTSDRRS